MQRIPAETRRRVVLSGLLLGVGLMGVLDGALFHEVLGWHHLLDRQTSDPRANALADGLFHLAMWALIVVGVVVLLQAASRLPDLNAGRTLLGAALLGAAAFNAVEVVVDHFVLDLHRLHPSGDLTWDVGFVVLNLAVAGGALALLRLDGNPSASRERRMRQRLERDYAR